MDLQYSNEKLAHRMKVLRAESRMDQGDLADAAGISLGSVARYEMGGTTPSLEAAYKMAVALGCSIDDLVSLPAVGERGE